MASPAAKRGRLSWMRNARIFRTEEPSHRVQQPPSRASPWRGRPRPVHFPAQSPVPRLSRGPRLVLSPPVLFSITGCQPVKKTSDCFLSLTAPSLPSYLCVIIINLKISSPWKSTTIASPSSRAN
jgi:hypothetical protein